MVSSPQKMSKKVLNFFFFLEMNIKLVIIILGVEMDFEFKVSYKMEMREAKKDIEVRRNLCFTKSRNLSFIIFKKKEAQIFRESEY